MRLGYTEGKETEVTEFGRKVAEGTEIHPDGSGKRNDGVQAVCVHEAGHPYWQARAPRCASTISTTLTIKS